LIEYCCVASPSSVVATINHQHQLALPLLFFSGLDCTERESCTSTGCAHTVSYRGNCYTFFSSRQTRESILRHHKKSLRSSIRLSYCGVAARMGTIDARIHSLRRLALTSQTLEASIKMTPLPTKRVFKLTMLLRSPVTLCMSPTDCQESRAALKSWST